MKNKVDILNHELVPKHVVLTDEAKKSIMKIYGIRSLNQFPKILKSDPAINEIKTKPGDLIKIVRTDNAKESIYYRVVIEG